MAATEEMLEIALRHRPHAACIVPEKREERTTEGGLDAAGQHNHLAPFVARARARRTSASACSSSPTRARSRPRSGSKAPVVEFHTGRYAHLRGRGAGRGAAPHRRRRRARGQERHRAPCRPRPHLRQCRAGRRHPAARASSISAISWSARRSSPASTPSVAADARADGRGAVSQRRTVPSSQRFVPQAGEGSQPARPAADPRPACGTRAG